MSSEEPISVARRFAEYLHQDFEPCMMNVETAIDIAESAVDAELLRATTELATEREKWEDKIAMARAERDDIKNHYDKEKERADKAEASLKELVDHLAKTQRPNGVTRDTRLGAAILDCFLPKMSKKLTLKELQDAYHEMLDAINGATALLKRTYETQAVQRHAPVELLDALYTAINGQPRENPKKSGQ